MQKILLIPSATFVCDELKFELGYITTAMIPLSGKPVFEHIINKYKNQQVDSIFLACSQGKDRVSTYVDNYEMEVDVIDIPLVQDLGYTILESLRFLHSQNSLDDCFLYVNFADTIDDTNYFTECQDFVVYCSVDDPFRWTSFEISSCGRISSITEKHTAISERSKNIFLGVFGISNPKDFLQIMEAYYSHNTSSLDLFYLSLTEYLSTREYKLIPSKGWVDVGHLDTYYSAKKTMINCRSFNQISVNPKTNILTKRSDNKKKLIDEILWYIKLPKQIQYLSPHIYDFSLDYLDPYIEMEYVGYPCLSDAYLYGSYTLGTWNTIINNIFSVVDDMRLYAYQVDSGLIKETLYEMYYTKTIKRLNSLKNDNVFSMFFNNEVIINGKSYKSLNFIITHLIDALEKYGVLCLDCLTLIHGDLCLPNLFYDFRNSGFKMIDPRGSFGKFDMYGDYRYEYAKLRHSICGYYDFIINNLFEITVDYSQKAVCYSFFSDKKHEAICKLFNEKLESSMGKDTNLSIKLIESLLFLSMAPLHSDNIERQYLMLTLGIIKFNDVYSSRCNL